MKNPELYPEDLLSPALEVHAQHQFELEIRSNLGLPTFEEFCEHQNGRLI
jgi:hypothetical protein